MAQSSDNALQLPVGPLRARTFEFARRLGCCLVHCESSTEYGGVELAPLLSFVSASRSSTIIFKGVQPVIDPDLKISISILSMAEDVLCRLIGVEIFSALPITASRSHSCRISIPDGIKPYPASKRKEQLLYVDKTRQRDL